MLAVEHVFLIDDSIERLDARGTFRDHADSARRGDGRDGGVSHLEFSFAVVNGPLEIGEHAPFLGQKGANFPGLFLHEFHDLFGHDCRRVRIIRDAELDEHIGEPHDAKPHFPVVPGHFGDFRQRVIVHFDDIVEEPDRRADGIAELKVIYFRFAVLGSDHVGKVYRSEVAGLIG